MKTSLTMALAVRCKEYSWKMAGITLKYSIVSFNKYLTTSLTHWSKL